MEKQKLTAEKRKITGRKVKKLRKEGILPANIYGKEFKSLMIQLPVKNFLKVYDKVGETGVIDLTVDDKTYPVLIHNLQRHPVTGEPLHVDFHRVLLTEKVKATVPIVTIGEAPAVAQKMGILLTPVSELEVEALPTDLPEKIEVDISSLSTIGQELKIKDLKIPKSFVILADPELVIAKIGELVTEETKKILEEEKAKAEAAAAQAATEKGETSPVEEKVSAQETPQATQESGEKSKAE